MPPASEDGLDDHPRGDLWRPGRTDRGPLATPRLDLLAVAVGAGVATLFVGLLAGGLAVVFGRARERFVAGYRAG